jgi:hypothetical protein
MIFVLAILSLVAVMVGLLAFAWSRQRLGVASTVAFAIAVAAWVADFAAVSSGFGDADGFVDCGDACTATHRVAALGFLVPPLLISISAAGMLVALVSRGRRRRGGA